jgi:hypothetical protein
MMIPKNKSHQFRFSEEARPIHVKRMHDSARAMFSTLDVDWDLQWSKGKPVYQMEPLLLDKGVDDLTISQLMGYKVKIFDFDRLNAEMLESRGLNSEWRPFLLNDGLMKWVGEYGPDRDIDVLHIGGIFPRRREIIEKLKANTGVQFEQVFGVYGEDATKIMKRAKVIINIHRDGESQAQEQLRIAWAIACGCTVVSETSLKPSIPNSIVIESPLVRLYDKAIKAVNEWSFDDSERRKALYVKLSEKYKKEIWKL